MLTRISIQKHIQTLYSISNKKNLQLKTCMDPANKNTVIV